MTRFIRNSVFAAVAVISGSLFFTGCGKNIALVLTAQTKDDLIYSGGMADSRNGYAIGENGLVRYTEDGGVTWPVGNNKSAPLFSLSIIDEKVCFATGENKTFIKTIDGGKNWAALKNHLGKRSKGSCFKNEKIGCVWTTSNACEYIAENDEWTAIKNPKGCGLVESVYSVAPGKAYLCGSNGMIYYTEDYGNNWEERQKIFDKKNDEIKPIIGQWTKTSEFDFNDNVLRFAYLAEKNYEYSLVVYKSLDNGRTFVLESSTKLANNAKAIAFNCNNGISVFNTDCSLDFFRIK